MDYSYLKPVNPETIWYNRLIPQVLFEDTKALAKIEKTLRIIGLHGFGFYPVDHPPSEIKFMNRVWVCQARNQLSSVYLDKDKKNLKHFLSNQMVIKKLFCIGGIVLILMTTWK
jgi:hypothetical protein